MKENKNMQSREQETDSNVNFSEISLLDESIENSITKDSINLKRAALDNTDEDGIPLNEVSSDLSGEDLDVPGAAADDADEMIGEEDEENNNYSQADTE